MITVFLGYSQAKQREKEVVEKNLILSNSPFTLADISNIHYDQSGEFLMLQEKTHKNVS